MKHIVHTCRRGFDRMDVSAELSYRSRCFTRFAVAQQDAQPALIGLSNCFNARMQVQTAFRSCIVDDGSASKGVT